MRTVSRILMVLVAFFGNYLVNNVAAGFASLVPATQGGNPILTTQYITFAVLAAITTGIMAWLYMWLNSLIGRPAGGLVQGLIFGAVGVVVAGPTALLAGIAGGL